jgi:hypothetical protein
MGRWSRPGFRNVIFALYTACSAKTGSDERLNSCSKNGADSEGISRTGLISHPKRFHHGLSWSSPILGNQDCSDWRL